MLTSLRNPQISFVINPSKDNIVLYLITSAVFSALLLPTLFQEGMFFDGVTYAAISNNLANGIGEFWCPIFSNNLPFQGHPPLAFGLQSILFHLLGDAFYIDRLYSIIMAMITAWGITLCWRLFNDKGTAWLPILLWIIVPITFWSYQNNMLENTMTAFTLFSTYFILKAAIKNKIIYLLWGAIFLICAFLSKGVVAFFPLAIPAFYFLIKKENYFVKAVIGGILLSLFSFLIMLTVFTLFPESRTFLINYFDIQVVASLQEKNDVTTSNRLSILGFLLSNLLPVFILTFASLISKTRSNLKLKKESILFFLIGISASLPIIISLKQREFYLVPSIPFFTLAFAFYLKPIISNIYIKTKIAKWLKIIFTSLIIIVIVFSISQFGKFHRNELMLKDIYAISKVVPPGSALSVKRNTPDNHLFYSCLARINYMSIDKVNSNRFFLAPKENNVTIKEGYTLVPIELNLYRLYQKISD